MSQMSESPKSEFYVYAHIRSEYAAKINKFFKMMDQLVEQKKISDLPSLMYPAHITLCHHFVEEDADPDEVFEDVRKVCKDIAGPIKVSGTVRKNLVVIDLVWPEMDQALEILAQRYPKISWTPKHYHCTLAQLTEKNDLKTIKPLIPAISPEIAKNILNGPFGICVWEYVNTESNPRYINKKKWISYSGITINHHPQESAFQKYLISRANEIKWSSLEKESETVKYFELKFNPARLEKAKQEADKIFGPHSVEIEGSSLKVTYWKVIDGTVYCDNRQNPLILALAK